MPLSDTPNVFSILEMVLQLREATRLHFARNIGGGLEFDHSKMGVTDADKQLPYAFVVPLTTVGKKVNRLECYQPREASMGIVVCIDGTKHKRNARGNNPVEATQAFAPLLASLEDALLTWKPKGFMLDEDRISMQMVQPLGADETCMWMMMEYSISYRHYHAGYGSLATRINEEFEQKWPAFKAESIEKLVAQYKAEGDFTPDTVWGETFWDEVPFPMSMPSQEAMDEFTEKSDVFNINHKVRAYIEERHEDALGQVPQIQDRPPEFPSFNYEVKPLEDSIEQ